MLKHTDSAPLWSVLFTCHCYVCNATYTHWWEQPWGESLSRKPHRDKYLSSGEPWDRKWHQLVQRRFFLIPYCLSMKYYFFKLDWKSPNSFCGHERTLNHVPGMSGDVQSQTEMLVCLLKPTLHIFIFLIFFSLHASSDCSQCKLLPCSCLQSSAHTLSTMEKRSQTRRANS